MESHAHAANDHAHHDHHHEMPTEGRALTGIAISATLHCLTGCAIGEITGMAIGTALGFSDVGTIALAVALAFLFGYSLTSVPLLRAGMALSAVIPIALASDTLSIATMEVVDNAVMVIIPGAMEAGLGSLLFWGSLSFALAVAGLIAMPVNRYLIARGRGHCAVHETGIHGGPPVKLVGIATVLAAVFGTAVLVGEAVGGDDDAPHGGDHAAAMTGETPHGAHTTTEEDHMTTHPNAAPELGVARSDLRVELGRTELPLDRETEFGFRVIGTDGEPVTDFDLEHERRMHLILVRSDLTGFQHLHPEMASDGTWSTPVELHEPGRYRAFADFSAGGEAQTIGVDITVAGEADDVPLPAESPRATTAGGYDVELAAGESAAGESTELAFQVSRDGDPVEVAPYLGADGHLVALREGDLAFLHVHPSGHEGGGHGAHGGGAHGGAAAEDAGSIRFTTEFPTAGRYRLFLQFKHEGKVRTAEFTRVVGE